MGIYTEAVQKLYVAYFNRPADPSGLLYWEGVVESQGGSTAAISETFSQSAEYKAYFDDLPNNDVVTIIYQNLFGRLPEPVGLEFWSLALDTGRLSISDAVTAIAGGAQGSDLTAYNNKVEAATAFTDAVDTTPEILAYSGLGAAATAQTWLAGVTDDASLAAALTTIDSTITTIVETPVIGSTFTLTSGADQADTTGSSKNGGLIASDFKFTSGNEKVTAVSGTLTTGDVLADGSTADADILDATLVAPAVVPTTSISNIETINVNVLGANAGVDMAAVLGAKAVNVTANAAAVLTNVAVASAPVIGLTGANNLTVTVDTLAGTTAAGTAESLSVKFNGATTGAGLTLGAATLAGAGALETLNIESAGAVKNTVALAAGANATGIGKHVVTGAADLELRAAAGILNGAELVAAGHTGALTINADFDGPAGLVGLNAEKFSGVDAYVVRDTAVTPGATAFGLFNIANDSNVRIADDIAAASSITVLGAAAGTAESINLTLQNRAAVAADVDVTGLTINGVETINITSAGAPTTGLAADQQNLITALNADKLATLNLDGASNLAVTLGAGTILAANTANILIDGSAATGKLTLAAGNIVDTTTPGRTVTLIGGSNDDDLTGSTVVAVKNVFDLTKGGNDIVRLNPIVADSNDSILGFGNGDKIALGAVAGTFVNGLDSAVITPVEQATIEAAASLGFAAVAAAAGAGPALNTALAFSYQGNQYIFMDDVGPAGSYDVGDAIVQITGITSTSTFDAGTFLFAA